MSSPSKEKDFKLVPKITTWQPLKSFWSSASAFRSSLSSFSPYFSVNKYLSLMNNLWSIGEEIQTVLTFFQMQSTIDKFSRIGQPIKSCWVEWSSENITFSRVNILRLEKKILEGSLREWNMLSVNTSNDSQVNKQGGNANNSWKFLRYRFNTWTLCFTTEQIHELMWDVSYCTLHYREKFFIFEGSWSASTLSTNFMNINLLSSAPSSKSSLGMDVHRYFHLFDNMLVWIAFLVERYDKMCWRIGSGKLSISFLLLLAFCFFLNFCFLALSKGKLTSIVLTILLHHITHCQISL